MEKTVFSALVAVTVFGIVSMAYLSITDAMQVDLMKSVGESNREENIRMIFLAFELALAVFLIKFLFKDLRKEARNIYGK